MKHQLRKNQHSGLGSLPALVQQDQHLSMQRLIHKLARVWPRKERLKEHNPYGSTYPPRRRLETLLCRLEGPSKYCTFREGMCIRRQYPVTVTGHLWSSTAGEPNLRGHVETAWKLDIAVACIQNKPSFPCVMGLGSRITSTGSEPSSSHVRTVRK